MSNNAEITFKADGHVTKRTVRFEEIDTDTMKPLEMLEAKIGKIYVKKSVFNGGPFPDQIKMKLEW